VHIWISPLGEAKLHKKEPLDEYLKKLFFYSKDHENYQNNMQY
jgi:hypothetical protein